MARTNRKEENPKVSATLQVNVEDFVRTRDAVVAGLANLHSVVHDLSRSYVAHTNAVIGNGQAATLDLLKITLPFAVDNALLGAHMNPPGPTSEPVENKKRKRAPHDKNAPKRPVTPYFLYMQTARPLIAREMEPGVSAKEVADEGTRRWNDMPSEEREQWSYKYAVNFARYKEKVKAYKAGQPIPEISDSEAKRLYEEQKRVGTTHEPPDEKNFQDREYDTETDSASSSELDGSPEPLKAPSPLESPRISKRRKQRPETDAKLPPSKRFSVKEPELLRSPTGDQMIASTVQGSRKKSSRKAGIRSPEKPSASKKDIMVAIASSPQLSNQDTQHKQKKSKKKRKSEGPDI